MAELSCMHISVFRFQIKNSSKVFPSRKLENQLPNSGLIRRWQHLRSPPSPSSSESFDYIDNNGHHQGATGVLRVVVVVLRVVWLWLSNPNVSKQESKRFAPPQVHTEQNRNFSNNQNGLKSLLKIGYWIRSTEILFRFSASTQSESSCRKRKHYCLARFHYRIQRLIFCRIQ